MTITEWLQDGFSKAFPGVELPEIKAVPATDPKFGDYQCNDALKVAKKAGFRNPREAAQKVVENLSSEYKVEIAGPGFLNITITPEWLSSALAALFVHRAFDQGGALALLAAIASAVAVYFVMILLFGGINEEDMRLLPRGECICRILSKYHLVRRGDIKNGREKKNQ